MKIGLIAMSGVRVRTAELAALGVTLPGFVRRGEVIASLPSLGLLTIAGMTPPQHPLRYLEIDELPDLSALPDFDLVAISSLTASVYDAYQVADAYRGRGIRVVMGGLHVEDANRSAGASSRGHASVSGRECEWLFHPWTGCAHPGCL